MNTLVKLIPLPALVLACWLFASQHQSHADRVPAPSDFSSASAFDVVVVGHTVHLLFAQAENDASTQLALYYTRSSDSGETWSSPMAIDSSHAPPGRHQPGNTPQLAVFGDRLMALWTAKGGGPWQSGPLATALSTDGGTSWKAGPAPANDANVGFRFPAATAGEKAFHVVWIHAVDSERSLRHASLDFETGRWSDVTVVDSEICACCWNTLRWTPEGELMVLYRDQDPSDMGLAISFDSGRSWESRGAVGDFDWFFNGCPHVGGGFAFSSSPKDPSPFLLSTVWTGHPEHGGAYILHSRNRGQTWHQAPIPGPRSVGHIFTDVAIRATGTAAIAWDFPQEDGSRTVFASTSQDQGISWTPPRQFSRDGAVATHPRLVATPDAFLLFWHQIDKAGAFSLHSATLQ